MILAALVLCSSCTAEPAEDSYLSTITIAGPLTFMDAQGTTYEYAGLWLPDWLEQTSELKSRLHSIQRSLVPHDQRVRITPFQTTSNRYYEHPPAIVTVGETILNITLVEHGAAAVKVPGFYGLRSFGKSLLDAQLRAGQAQLGIWDQRMARYPFVRSRKSNIVHAPFCRWRFKISRANYLKIPTTADSFPPECVPCTLCLKGQRLPQSSGLPTLRVSLAIAAIAGGCLIWLWHGRSAPLHPADSTSTGKKPRRRRSVEQKYALSLYLEGLSIRLHHLFRQNGVDFVVACTDSEETLTAEQMTSIQEALLLLNSPALSKSQITLSCQSSCAALLELKVLHPPALALEDRERFASNYGQGSSNYGQGSILNVVFQPR